MVKSIQIRDVPDDVHATLRSRAAAAGMSLSEYLLDEVTRVAARPPIADALRSSTIRRWGVEPGVAVGALRAERDRR